MNSLGNGYVGSYAEAVFNNTWGHTAPVKNTSYPGKVLFTITDHSQYGCQPIILTYDFNGLRGPYIHNKLFGDVCDWNTDEFKPGEIYEIKMTFRNYRFYYSKPKLVYKQ